jgi:hypothetical protein
MRGHRRGFRVPGRCRGRRRVIALELEDCEVRDERSQWQAVVHLCVQDAHKLQGGASGSITLLVGELGEGMFSSTLVPLEQLYKPS